MNICLLTRAYPESDDEPIVSGMNKNPYYLSQTLQEQGHEVTVVTHGQKVIARTVGGVTVKQIGEGYLRGFVRAATESVKGALECRRLIDESGDYDVLNVHYAAPGVGLAKQLGALAVPLVSTAHGTILPEIRANVGSNTLHDRLHLINALAKSRLDRYSWEQSDKVITAGEFQVAEMEEIYGLPKSKLRPIANGVDTDHYRPDEERRQSTRADLGLQDSNVILYVGRLVKKKGLQYLVRALAELERTDESIELVVVGGTPAFDSFGDQVRRLARSLSVSDCLTFVSGVSERDLPSYYNAADVCAVPSVNYEPLPTVVFEAMASGNPVVGSNSWGIPGQVGSGDTLVPEKDTDSLTSMLARVFEDPEWAAELGEKNRRRACQYFDWSEVAQSYVDTYREARS